jgi:hypothetical protein
MIKTLAAAAVLSLALSGYALAQSTVTGAPAGSAPENAEPPAPMHHHHHYHHHHYHHHMHHMAPEAAPAPAPAQ